MAREPDFWDADHRAWSRRTVAAFAVVTAVGIAWSAWAELDEVVRAGGRVIPSSQVQVVQSLEGGILAELAVKQGDLVQQGQLLARIDDTRFSSMLNESRAKSVALQAEIARLSAEAEGASAIAFPADVRRDARVMVDSETHLFQSNRKALEETVGSLQRSLDLAQRQLELARPLHAQGVVADSDMIKLERDVNELSGSIADKRNMFRARAGADLSTKRGDLAALTEAMRGAEDRVARTTLKAPVRGVVKQVLINTIGGVIGPGDRIMELVPLDDSLLIEAKLRPVDVAFVRPGQDAVVKVTAYDFARFGSLRGRVEFLSADAVDEKIDGREQSFFRILVRTDRDHFGSDEAPLRVMPGMAAEVDVLTGKRTVLEYMLRPLVRAQQTALTER